MTSATLPISVGLKGFYTLSVVREGKVIRKVGPFPNLITNQGLDFLGGRGDSTGYGNPTSVCGCCSVGTGTTPPAITDTGLSSYLTGINGSYYQAVGFGVVYVGTPTPLYQASTTWTFPAGAATGNLTEIGTGMYSASSNTKLFSHALIVDGTGAPTVLVVTSADQLIVTYTVQCIINTTDTSYSFPVNGTTLSGIFRVMYIGTTPLFLMGAGSVYNNNNMFLYTGTIGATSGGPSGTSIPLGRSLGSYSAGSYLLPMSYTSAVQSGTTSYNSISFDNAIGSWQFSLSSPIVVTPGQTVSISCSVSWNRL